MKLVQVKMPDALRERMERFAHEAGHTKAGIIRAALEDYLRERSY